MSEATSVTSVPVISATTIVRVCSVVPPCGSSAPNALNASLSAGASPRPASRPSSEPISLIDDRLRVQSAFEAEPPALWRPPGPSRPELARALGDRDREGVEDHEAANEQRDPGEREQRRAEELEARLDVLGLAGGLLLPSARSPAPEAPPAVARDQLVGSHPAWHRVDAVELPDGAGNALRLGERQHGHAGSGERVHIAVLRDPDDAVATLRPFARKRQRVAELEALVARGVAVDRSSPARGAVALHDRREGVERLEPALVTKFGPCC